MKGHGTVVTGVPISGAVKAGDTLELLPSGKKTGLRAIQNYRHESQTATAHISSALNLRDLQPEEIQRGMCLAAPGVYQATKMALALVRNDSESLVLKQRRDLRVLAQTASVVCRVRLLSSDSIKPGQSAYVVLNFEEPIALAAGDKFILRILSPEETIGGGVILSANPGRVRRTSPNLIPRLDMAFESVSQGDYFGSALYAGGSAVLTATRVSALTQSESASALKQVEDKVQKGDLVPVGMAQWFCTARSEEVKSRIAKILARYHRENKNAWGMKPEYAASFFGIEPAGSASLAKIITEGEGEIVMRHGFLALKSFSPQISQKEIKLREQTLELLSKQDFQIIAKGELQEKLQMSGSELKLIMRMLSDEGLVVVTGNYIVSNDTFEEFKASVLHLFKEHKELELKTIRDKTGMGRNAAVTLLELLDNQGVTKRKGNVRVLL
jgi:selenocysteine-specific elongation factor